MQDIFWNLDSVYPALDSAEYIRDKKELADRSAELQEALGKADPGDPAGWAAGAIASLNRLSDLAETLFSYVYALWSVNTAEFTA